MKLKKKIEFSFALLPNKYKAKLIRLSFFQLLLPALDLVGIFLLGVLIQSLLNPSSIEQQQIVQSISNHFPSLFEKDSREALLFLSFLSAIVFILKGLISTLVIRKTFQELTNASSDFSSQIARDFFSENLATIHRFPSNRVGYALNDSISHQIVSILGSASSLVGELSLIFSICIFLFFYNGPITLLCIAYFLIVFIVLQKKLRKVTSELAEIRALSDSKIRTMVQESIDSYRELFVVDALPDMLSKYDLEREKSADSQGMLFWLANLPKYVFESVLIIGVVIMISASMIMNQVSSAQFGIATFLIAGVRILPSILRVQALSNGIEYSFSTALFLRELLELKLPKKTFLLPFDSPDARINSQIDHFSPHILIADLNFKYHENDNFALNVKSLSIKRGEKIGLVGASGSGKSTFADLLLGVLSPDQGKISISDLPPNDVVKFFPGRIGYVPQTPNLFSTDVFGNIALHKPRTLENIERAWECLEMAQLSSLIKELPEGIETSIGERGFKLSGGQKQRLSLARALFTKPNLLVLDEATSALDAEIENEIGVAIDNLGLDTTVIVIAHRLSTVKTFDRLLYFENGQIIADGTFSYLQNTVEKFAKQVSFSVFNGTFDEPN